jgi:hypothetical protein
LVAPAAAPDLVSRALHMLHSIGWITAWLRFGMPGFIQPSPRLS